MKRSLSYCLAFLLSSALCLRAQDTDEDEEGDLDLLNRVVELIDDAELGEVLEDRKRLQDLDLNDLSGAQDVLTKELKKLQADGVIPIEAIRKAVEGGLESKEELGNASDLLGPEPKKGQKVAAEEKAEWISIENSKSMVLDEKKGLIIFDGDVLVTNKNPGVKNPFSLRCDKLVAHFEIQKEGKDIGKRRVSYAEATGRMVVINGVNEQGDPVEARCRKAVLRDGTIVLRDWPELSMPGKLMKATDKNAYIEATTGKNSSFNPRGAFEVKLKNKAEEE